MSLPRPFFKENKYNGFSLGNVVEWIEKYGRKGNKETFYHYLTNMCTDEDLMLLTEMKNEEVSHMNFLYTFAVKKENNIVEFKNKRRSLKRKIEQKKRKKQEEKNEETVESENQVDEEEEELVEYSEDDKDENYKPTD